MGDAASCINEIAVRHQEAKSLACCWHGCYDMYCPHFVMELHSGILFFPSLPSPSSLHISGCAPGQGVGRGRDAPSGGSGGGGHGGRGGAGSWNSSKAAGGAAYGTSVPPCGLGSGGGLGPEGHGSSGGGLIGKDYCGSLQYSMVISCPSSMPLYPLLRLLHLSLKFGPLPPTLLASLPPSHWSGSKGGAQRGSHHC